MPAFTSRYARAPHQAAAPRLLETTLTIQLAAETGKIVALPLSA